MNNTDLTDFFDACYGATTGRLHIAVGDGPHWGADDKYSHEHWTQTHFAYPAERDQAAGEIARAALAGGDVYVCPNLMHADKRARGAAAARMVVHSDVDEGRYDPDKVSAAGGFAVASGTPGNAHVYVPLSESVPADVHRELCRGLSRYLGAVDPKISDNDLLRPPGTLNYKAAALGGDPTPVQLLSPPNGRVAPAVLAELVGAGQPNPAPAAAVEQINLDRYPTVKAALAAVTAPPDRSKDTMRVVAACYDAGLTLPQTRAAVATRADLAERLDGRGDDDVATCWLKAIDERQPAAADTAGSPAVDGAALLDDLEAWYRRFIAATDDIDLALLALWTVHTHLARELYTTPRLWLDSVLPASGKTTVLDHLERLALRPIQMAMVSSSALLPRILEKGPRTILLDEIQRSLDPNKPGVGDVLAVINTGYRVGAKRPVLVPTKGGGWDTADMSTFAPLAMAGSSPQLPDDTISRSIRVVLMPDLDGMVEDSDWEHIESDARALRARIADFADTARTTIRAIQVELPAGCTSRQKEKWRPLKRVAVVAGGRWPDIAHRLAARGLAEDAAENEAGLRYLPPGMVALTDLRAVWPQDQEFMSTRGLVDLLKRHNPDYWDSGSPYGKPLTDHRFARLVAQATKTTSQRLGGRGPRGYLRVQLEPAWRRLGIAPTPLYETGACGGNGETGDDGTDLTDSAACTDLYETPPGQAGGAPP